MDKIVGWSYSCDFVYGKESKPKKRKEKMRFSKERGLIFNIDIVEKYLSLPSTKISKFLLVAAKRKKEVNIANY
jgi:hypothetical protein